MKRLIFSKQQMTRIFIETGLVVFLGVLGQMVSPFTQDANAAPGDLDLTFGNNGIVITDFGTAGSDSGEAIVIQPDWKIVVGGGSSIGPANADFSLARYYSNGMLDPGFGGSGKVWIDFARGLDRGLAMALQADGKIVIAGEAGDFALARVNGDGSLDETFGTGGKVITDFAAGNDEIYALAIQDDGKIIAAGFANYTDFAIARYNPNGTLDATFGLGGKVTTDFDGSVDIVYSLGIQNDGKIVAAGFVIVAGRTIFGLVRYHSDGSLDAGFGVGGVVTTDFGGSLSVPYALALQSDGKILVAGMESGDLVLARYLSDGSLDSGFGTGGKVLSPGALALGLAVQANGKILAVGQSNGDLALFRYQPDGSPDTGFGVGGVVTTDLGTDSDIANGVVLQEDGKITVAGQNGIVSDFVISRYWGDPGPLPLNDPPSLPVPVFPADGQTGLHSRVVFGWHPSTDLNGNPVSYDLIYCLSPEFSGCKSQHINSPDQGGGKRVGGSTVVYSTLVVFGIVMAGSLKGRKAAECLLIVVGTFFVLVSCGSDENMPVSSSIISHDVSGLDPATTYYWKVVADDGNGGVASSEAWSFTTG